ncbi:peptide/nickel transport system ATP-binding protein [Albimonas donghaensis]|uniref:Peptide/nickel transport system ATP-binding protein n=1 Tax=Albimonas donghaensis TaxID=356660 RepID=A0A1H2TCH0_9RHOB|nr:ABC transporter ATP-binding protein [Albimonas donghaensis]SDW41520.1 peptide/nickel transport system ATP-binding protein [Albimonas donghaensis]
MTDLLEIEGLDVEFPTRRGTVKAARGVGLRVARGEVLGLVGESGAGKSTIGAAIIDLLEPPGRVAGGRIDFQGESLRGRSEAEMRRIRGDRIGMIFQDPQTSLDPLKTIGEQLVETIRKCLGLNEAKAKARAEQLLVDVGITEAKTRLGAYPHQFSGGMRQRVVIALALAGEPDLIIADEPTTALDVSIQAQILDLIKALCRERNVGVIIVTHDIGVIANIADRVCVMYRGEVVETGDVAQILGAPRHEYTRSLIAAVPRADRRLPRFASVDYIEGGASAFRRIDVKTHWLGAAVREAKGEGPALSVAGLDLSFTLRRALLPKNRKMLKAVNDVSFDVAPGETFGIVGESGSGKSTVARIIAGLYKPDAGVVRLMGQDVSTAPRDPKARAARRSLQMIFQDPYSSLNARMRVLDIVAEPIRFFRLAESEAEVRRIVGDLLDHVGLGAAAARRYPHEFSGGQRQRISIARALASRPRILICDEPTSALDVSVQATILNLLRDLQEELGLTMLFISHDLPVIRQMCDRVAVMRHGAICEIAPAERLFEAPGHDYTRHLIDLMPSMDLLEPTPA